MQWAFEQEEAGGEVNFKEGLAFYSSIGILQVREHLQLATIVFSNTNVRSPEDKRDISYACYGVRHKSEGQAHCC